MSPEEGGGDKAVYEESILMSILGKNYSDFISSKTGEWEKESKVLDRFYQ